MVAKSIRIYISSGYDVHSIVVLQSVHNRIKTRPSACLLRHGRGR